MAKVEGTVRLERKLTTFPKNVRTEVEGALIRNAREFVSMAKRLVPVDKGELQESIDWFPGEVEGGRKRNPPGAQDIAVSVFAGDEEAWYARMAEFGTPPHKSGGFLEGQHPGMTAHPYFYPSWRAIRKKIRARNRYAMRRAAKKMAATG